MPASFQVSCCRPWLLSRSGFQADYFYQLRSCLAAMQYDDFGNPISETGEGGGHAESPMDPESEISGDAQHIAGSVVAQVPSAGTRSPGNVEFAHYEHDLLLLEEPTIAPAKEVPQSVDWTSDPKLDDPFHLELLNHPSMMRNLALVGHVNHGKTSFMNFLLENSQMGPENVPDTDSSPLERDYEKTLVASPASLLVPDFDKKTHLLNVIDTPGHPDFAEELAVGIRLADAIVVVVDVVEGLLPTAEIALKEGLSNHKKSILVLNKIDRLILDLQLSPQDAYLRLQYVIAQVNDFIAPFSPQLYSPSRGNVVFASAEYRWCFNLETFARWYCRNSTLGNAIRAQQLWGDIYYSDGEFKRSGRVYSFVHFVLEPLYKIHQVVLTEEWDKLAPLIQRRYLKLIRSKKAGEPKDRLRLVFASFLEDNNVESFVASVLEHTVSPLQAQPPLDTGNNADVSADVVKLIWTPDMKPLALCRIYAGPLKIGQPLSFATLASAVRFHVTGVWIPQASKRLAVDYVPIGSWALVTGIEEVLAKSGTITSSEAVTALLPPMQYIAEPVIRVGVQPVHPRQRPDLLEGLRLLDLTHGALQVYTEESGEHVVVGTGELYMNVVMRELRHRYANIEISVSDPATPFRETCIEQSYIALPARSPNEANRLTVISAPLEMDPILDAQSAGTDEIKAVLKSHYEWDGLAIDSLWSHGPGNSVNNLLVDDTFGDKTNLLSVRTYLEQGFLTGVMAGPLCDEPVRQVNVKLMNAEISSQSELRGPAQISPTMRRAFHSSLLVASPRLMEPVFKCTIVGPIRAGRPVYAILKARRGEVTRDEPIPGTPLYLIEGFLPVIDSTGFEVDVRLAAGGQAAVSLTFLRWSLVPGDPLDSSLPLLGPLEAATGEALARDFMLKTRKRKGLGTGPILSRFLDPDVAEQIA